MALPPQISEQHILRRVIQHYKLNLTHFLKNGNTDCTGRQLYFNFARCGSTFDESILNFKINMEQFLCNLFVFRFQWAEHTHRPLYNSFSPFQMGECESHLC